MNLSPKDRALVLESRAHWKRMRDDPEGCREMPRAGDCALCNEYLLSTGTVCGECPVVQVTGKIFCLYEIPCPDASDRHQVIQYTEPDTDERHLVVLAFQQAADRVIAWIDEHLLGESPEPDDSQPTCPKCGSTDISLHLCFKDNSAGCRSCRHEWLMDVARAALPYAGDPLGLSGAQLGGDALLPREHAALVRRRALSDDQQLPSEVTRAAEGKGDDG